MSKIIITCDSPCDWEEKYKDFLDIKTIPLHVVYDNDEVDYLDRVNITPDFIFNRFEETKVLPKTSAVSVGEYVNFFRTWLTYDTKIVHISLSSNISSCYQNALIASDILGDEGIYIFDSKSLSTGMMQFCYLAQKAKNEGKTPEEIIEILNENESKVNMSFVVDTMDFLKAGGRCSAVATLGAAMLKIHPMIQMDYTDGSLKVKKKIRGDFSMVVKSYLDDIFKNYENTDPEIMFVVETGCSDEMIDYIYNRANELGYYKKIVRATAGSVITSHCGRNTIGVSFLEK